MKLPRWTTYPALLVLSGPLWMAVPAPSADPHAGAALEARAGAETVASMPASTPSETTHPRLVILGIDGLDPDILMDVMARFPELTPNFRALHEAAGGIQDLGTSNPPQSPVAWSNFITGMNPGGHGIFDFIHRDPVTRMVASPITVDEAGTNIHIPGTTFLMPWGGSSEPNRTGKAFWEILAEQDIDADVWRMPINYPVQASKGVSFPGMMTPAVDSAYGESTLYTTDSVVALGTKGKRRALRFRGGKAETSIEGPVNTSKFDPDKSEGEHYVHPTAVVPLTIYADEAAGAAALSIDGKMVVLEPGEWSDFVQVTFSMMPMGMSDMNGIVRFYLRSMEPEFELYMSPVNMDPTAPAVNVSEPSDASDWLAGEIGLYYTQGMAEDVGALKSGLIDEREFMEQLDLVYTERNRMLDTALDRYLANEDGGLLFFYYSTVDLGSHMMWRLTDEEHPAFDAELASEDSSHWSGRPGSTWKDSITDLILRMDPVLGEIRARVGLDTPIVVMSDHGFGPYHRKFGLNTWLFENGYLVLKDGLDKELPEDAEGFAQVNIFDAVDWSKTRAYGVGFNGLYLNRAGRELDDPSTPEDESGIVTAAEADALMAEIKAKLEAIVDPATGERPVYRVDLAKQVYSGPRLGEAPDMIVGYNLGYDNSDEATTGRITHEWLADNLGGSFNGSHLMSPDVVAGILLTNRPLRAGAHALPDVTSAILHFYSVDQPKELVGSPAFD